MLQKPSLELTFWISSYWIYQPATLLLVLYVTLVNLTMFAPLRDNFRSSSLAIMIMFFPGSAWKQHLSGEKVNCSTKTARPEWKPCDIHRHVSPLPITLHHGKRWVSTCPSLLFLPPHPRSLLAFPLFSLYGKKRVKAHRPHSYVFLPLPFTLCLIFPACLFPPPPISTFFSSLNLPSFAVSQVSEPPFLQ